jgi:hypothetical protein
VTFKVQSRSFLPDSSLPTFFVSERSKNLAFSTIFGSMLSFDADGDIDLNEKHGNSCVLYEEMWVTESLPERTFAER